MEISLLCNAGLALTYGGATLLVDVLNKESEPFCGLKTELCDSIKRKEPPFDNICGLYFTHDHPDHFDREKVKDYLALFPNVPVFLPSDEKESEKLIVGPFEIEYGLIDHAPMDTATPPHRVTWITGGAESIYIASDAKTDTQAHREFLRGRTADRAFWNAMYLSQPATRQLLKDTAKKNYIYHMPEMRPDAFGIWRKCEKNFSRYGDELTTVTVLDRYPTEVL